MGLLSRDAILAVQDRKTKDIEVPAWGGSVRVRTWTLAERDAFYAKSKDGQNASAWLVAQLVIDEAGAPVFKPEDVLELEKQRPEGVDTVVMTILALNTGGAKAVEDAGKNS